MRRGDSMGLQFATQEYSALRERLLAEFPDVDEDTLRDTLEGLSNLPDTISALIRSALEDEALSAGLSGRMTALSNRLARFSERARKKREIAREAMEEAGLSKLVEPDFTASLRPGGRSVTVTDERVIPAQYWKPQAPKLDRAEISRTLKSGRPIPGVALSNQRLTLALRVK